MFTKVQKSSTSIVVVEIVDISLKPFRKEQGCVSYKYIAVIPEKGLVEGKYGQKAASIREALVWMDWILLVIYRPTVLL